MNAVPSDPRLERYARAARRVADGDGCGCADTSAPFGSRHYEQLDDMPSAALRSSLGCGNPAAIADLLQGDIVLDLGSGGGLDVFLSARRVGPTGYVYGLDATREMVELAQRNALEADVTNVEFLHGDIARIPLPDATVDAVISNCVLVLAADKPTVFAEIARVLRPGGRLGISDIVRSDPTDNTTSAVECGAHATTIDRYADDLRVAGLVDVSIALTEPLGGGLSNAIVKAAKPTATIPPDAAT